MAKRILHTLITTAGLVVALSNAALGGGVFIPGDKQELEKIARPDGSQGSELAQCLNNPQLPACQQLSISTEDTALESFDSAQQSDVQVETFVLDLNDQTVATSDTPRVPDRVQNSDQYVVASSLAVSIEFAVNSAELQSWESDKLEILRDALGEDVLIDASFAVIGHTDASGGQAYNCDLSKRRANTVVRFLGQHLDPSRFIRVGAGEFLLKDPTQPRGRVNRRVSFLKLDRKGLAILGKTNALCP